MAIKKRAKAVRARAKPAPKSDDDSKLFAFLAVLLSIIGFLIVLLAKKDDKYAMFYAKQSLVLFIAAIVVWIIDMVLVWIIIIGWIIMFLLGLGLVILWLMGLIYSLSGKETELPIIGGFAKKFDL